MPGLATIVLGALPAHGITPPALGKQLDGVSMWEALNTNGTSPRHEIYYGVTELYVGAHGPAVRDAAGWKLIVNGGGGVGGWDLKPGSGGVPDTPPGAKLVTNLEAINPPLCVRVDQAAAWMLQITKSKGS